MAMLQRKQHKQRPQRMYHNRWVLLRENFATLAAGTGATASLYAGEKSRAETIFKALQKEKWLDDDFKEKSMWKLMHSYDPDSGILKLWFDPKYNRTLRPVPESKTSELL